MAIARSREWQKDGKSYYYLLPFTFTEKKASKQSSFIIAHECECMQFMSHLIKSQSFDRDAHTMGERESEATAAAARMLWLCHRIVLPS